jgi:hypothetical protein
MRRIIVLGVFLSFLSLPAFADEVPDSGDIYVPPEPVAPVEQPVTAAPPPFVELKSRSIAAGLGFNWGGGTLTYEGEDYPFTMKGVSLGDLGASVGDAVGDVANLERVGDFEGTYVAVEAAGAAGIGTSAVTMRNEHGVVISMRSDLQGLQLTLGAESLRVTLK